MALMLVVVDLGATVELSLLARCSHRRLGAADVGRIPNANRCASRRRFAFNTACVGCLNSWLRVLAPMTQIDRGAINLCAALRADARRVAGQVVAAFQAPTKAAVSAPTYRIAK